MKRRIFIAINLPEKIKNRLKEYREQHGELPVRWTKTPSLHLTLVFIGYVDNEQMLEACKITHKIAEETSPFFIDFKRIVLGPLGKEPRMIWLEGQTKEELTQLKNRLEKALLAGNIGLQKLETRAFSPHLTLARIKMEAWREAQINAGSVETAFPVQLNVNSMEVMESDLKFDGAEYATLEGCPLSGN